MTYNKRTNIFKQILFSRGMAVFLLFVVIFVGFGVFSIIGKSMAASRERKIAEAQAQSLVSKQQDLTMKLAELKTAEGQEVALREQFPVVSPGERVVVISDEATGSTGTVGAENSQTKGGFWEFLKHLFSKTD
jgi:hypothetical protein